MRKLSDKLIGILEINGDVSREDREVYEYALYGLGMLVINGLTSILIGVVLKVPWYCVLFLSAMMPLRSDAGGYHAPGAWKCYLLSCAMVTAALLWIKAELSFQTVFTICMAVPSCYFIFRYAPLESENKPLDAEEKKIIGKRARVIVTVEMTAGLACFLVNEKAACAILSAIICCGAGYAGWFIQMKQKRVGM